MSELTALTQQAKALKAQQRYQDAITLYKQAVQLAPDNAIAEHNLAAAYGDAEHYHDARYHAKRAIHLGSAHAATWLVLGRAEQGVQNSAAAEQALRQAVAIQTDFAEAYKELAQLIWMNTSSTEQASAPLIQAIKNHPSDPVLRLTLAKVFEGTGDLSVGLKVLRDTLQVMEDEVLHTAAAQLALDLEQVEVALTHAARAYELQTNYPPALIIYSYALMANDRPAEALAVIERYLEQSPFDQQAIAIQSTALRLLGDERYSELCDYQQLVQVYKLTTPEGWSDLTDYLTELRQVLRQRHQYQNHPFGQSVRHGSQQPSLLSFKDPVLQAFPKAIAPAIEDYLARLGQGGNLPLQQRNRMDWAFNGIWSVKLKPKGFHTNHVHSMGWISSACYIEVPPTVKQGSTDGWLKFGEPGIITSPRLGAQRYIKPEVGSLVLFPSYFWHGTVPFGGQDPRMSIAFDLIPASSV